MESEIDKREREYKEFIECGNVTTTISLNMELVARLGEDESLRMAKHQLANALAKEIVDKFAWDIKLHVRAFETQYSLQLYIHTESELRKAKGLLELWGYAVQGMHKQNDKLDRIEHKGE